MNSPYILKFCLDKGILIDKDLLNLFNETEDLDSIKLIIEKLINIRDSGQTYATERSTGYRANRGWS